MDESRKAFESWLMEEFGYRQDYLEYWRGEGDYRSHPDLRSRWQGWNSAWSASRAAVEIELPLGATKDDERLRHETSHEGSFNLCLYWAHNAIYAAEIKVKE